MALAVRPHLRGRTPRCASGSSGELFEEVAQHCGGGEGVALLFFFGAGHAGAGHAPVGLGAGEALILEADGAAGFLFEARGPSVPSMFRGRPTTSSAAAWGLTCSAMAWARSSRSCSPARTAMGDSRT